MREILFRGKRLTNGKWVRGYYNHISNGEDTCNGERHYIQTEHRGRVGMAYNVDPESVGQFVGLIDKKGKKIFEGDIVRLYCGIYGTYEMHISDIRNGFGPIEEEKIKEIEIIGNIHDNPELWEVK